MLLILAIRASVLPVEAQSRPKLPKPQRMDTDVSLKRDASSGELTYRRGQALPQKQANESADSLVLRTSVRLVEVNCNVISTDGADLKGLRREDFRIYQDDVEQQVEHFDASSEAASLTLVFDASPSVTRDLEEMKHAARTLAANLAPADEVAVIAVERDSILLLPFSKDRALLEEAIGKIQIVRDIEKRSESNVYRAVYLAAKQLFPGRTGRKAIVLLTDGQDSGLRLDWYSRRLPFPPGEAPSRLFFEDVARALSAGGIEAYAVSTEPRPKAMTPEWLQRNRSRILIREETRKAGIPHYTAYLAELVRVAGGRLFFLRESDTLSAVYQRIAENLRTQYTLGFYAGRADGKWHTLRVEVAGRREARVRHRVAYFAGPGE
jgi:Ca-activated chloride channel family protein